MGISITGHTATFYAHMLAVKGALELERKGLKRRGTSAAKIAKIELGKEGYEWKGQRISHSTRMPLEEVQKLYDQWINRYRTDNDAELRTNIRPIGRDN
jgi:hypothetical protein